MAVEEQAADRPLGGRSGIGRVEPGRESGRRRWVAVGARLVAAIGLVAVAVLAYRYAAAPGGGSVGAANEELVALLLALLIVVAAAAVVVLRPERGEVGLLTKTAVVWTLALLGTLAVLWFLIDGDVREEIGVGTPVFDPAEVDAYLGRALPEGDAPPLLIPTGVLLQSIEFLNANNVKVSGFVWQRYDPSLPADLTKGVVLPEAVDGAYQATQAYAVEENGAQVVGWRIDATLRQAFDYRHFPFDRQDVWLRLWPQEADRDVVLVPDFGAYAATAPASLPGLDPRFVYGGWAPEYAAFSYAADGAATALGFGVGSARAAYPDLFFNVGLKRDFLGPFFDHIVLAVAVALLLFVVLALTTNDDDLQRRFGFNTAGVVGSASGLLFAVILKHSQIRGAIGSSHIAYLEVLPFVLYFFVVLVALNAILLASPIKVPPIEYKKNILPTLAYWPALLGALLVVTVVVFYL
jgi:hypothetical protein